MQASQNIKLQRVILFVSLVLFACKLWAWWLTHAAAILTDALESIVNIIAGFMGLYALRYAARPPDANHPYGHGKIEYVSAAVEGTLIIAASLLITYQALAQLLHPVPLKSLDAGMLLTALTGVINYIVGAMAARKGQAGRSATLQAAGQHLKTDAYSSALVVAGVALVYFTDIAWIDSMVALGFAVFIFHAGYKVLRQSLAGILDEANEKILQELVDLLQQNRQDTWIDLHNLRLVQYGEILHVDAHLTLPWYLQVKDADDAIQALETLTSQHFGGLVELFLHIDGCRYFQCHICGVQDCPVRAEPQERQEVWTVPLVMRDQKHGKEDRREP